jgi:hypothetical protein
MYARDKGSKADRRNVLWGIGYVGLYPQGIQLRPHIAIAILTKILYSNSPSRPVKYHKIYEAFIADILRQRYIGLRRYG